MSEIAQLDDERLALHKEVLEKEFQAAWDDDDRMATDIGDGFVLTPNGLGLSREATDDEYLKAAAILKAKTRVASDTLKLCQFRMGDLMVCFSRQHQVDEERTLEAFALLTDTKKTYLRNLWRVAITYKADDRKPGVSWGTFNAALSIPPPADPEANAKFIEVRNRLIEEIGDKPRAKAIVRAMLLAEKARFTNTVSAAINPKITDAKDTLLERLASWYQLRQLMDNNVPALMFPNIPEKAWLLRQRQLEQDIDNLLTSFGYTHWYDVIELPFTYTPKQS